MLECLVYQRYLFVSEQVRISEDTAVDREQYHMMQDTAKSTENRVRGGAKKEEVSEIKKTFFPATFLWNLSGSLGKNVLFVCLDY
ncbi:hypothetical protein CEXT_517461 [Caerostris extrusa]|uniref:Uncharacterized protein n=1 Tax=Caerostris extrusa TaxID=172846 RepID=A0AAV4W5I1_CAEEX|nr:hypothetical protein CEXT_517461 [Caerostris extrusa]